MKPRRVLMVCLGNICRSPVAQGIFEAELHQRFGSQHGWTVDSAGTVATHQGEAPDPRSQASARRVGVDISGQQSRPLRNSDFDEFDHILVMDRSNYADVLLRAPEVAKSKVSMILEASFPGEGREVPDPYWGGDQGFEQVVQLLQHASQDWIARWQD
ncbi:MAG: low molecular weight protein-tyrosine-phosphatase [Schleiferiaceae bacterium]